jgi:isopentenyl diphosphate isomerase/L-lactate dehydrogenase-like FMN-dependent dehydrogenase
VLEMLAAEFKLALALAGCKNLAEANTPRLVRRLYRVG